MQRTIPRLLISAVGSGTGKTTVTAALLSALCARGMRVQSLKCGPDYIDPMFHQRVLGIPGENLDLFFADAKKHTLPIIIELSVFVNPYFSVSGDLLYEYEISQECYIMFTWILAEKSEKGLTSR